MAFGSGNRRSALSKEAVSGELSLGGPIDLATAQAMKHPSNERCVVTSLLE